MNNLNVKVLVGTSLAYSYDLSLVDKDTFNSVSDYVRTDVNGDNFLSVHRI